MGTRVLVVDDANDMGGAQHVLLRLDLAPAGVEVVLASSPGSQLGEHWRAAGRELVELPSPGVRSIRRQDGRPSPVLAARTTATSLAQVGRLRRLARQVRADVVMSNTHWSHLDVVLAGRASHLPTVLYLHDMAIPGVGAGLRRLVSRLASATIAVSPAVAEQVGGRRVHVVPNGVDVERFAPGDADAAIRAGLGGVDDSPLAVVVARPDPIKRVHLAVEAAARVPGLRLAVIGPWDGDGIAAEVRELAAGTMGERCVFAGPRHDVADCLRAADLLIHPSSSEGSPLVILEAEATGTPVVAFDVPGVPRAVCPDGGVVVPDAAGADGLAEAISGILAESGRLDAMGRAAAEWTAAHHSVREQAAAVARILAGVAR